MIGDITKKTPISNYQPSIEIVELTRKVKKYYETGVEIIQKPWVELNNRSVIDDYNHGLMMFNTFVDTETDDPDQLWRWKGTRSKARNKGIATHANLTANYLLPLFDAQNDDDEKDKGFSEVMRTIIEWMIQPNVSNYLQSFLQVTLSMLYSPIVYLGADFNEIYQTIKLAKEDGTIEKKEVLDEILSGFKCPVYGPTQILLTNAFERNIQKQRAIIKRRFCEREELEAEYKNHPHWKFVQNGIRSIYNEEDGLFYDVFDDEHPDLVAEETYLNRREDAEICFVNGIYLGEKNIDHNPIKHRDNKDRPKYNLTPFGYARIGETFAYYKSQMNILKWDNMMYDEMSKMVMNRAILEIESPLAISGVDPDDINTAMVFPNSISVFADKDARVSPILPNSNLAAGFKVLEESDDTMQESSVSETMSGQLPEASQKAYSVAQAQTSARRMIGAVAKTMAESVVQYGDLMKDIAINHYTAVQVSELMGDKAKLKYRSFNIATKDETGNNIDKTVKFDTYLIGKEMTEKEKEMEEYKRLEQTNYHKTKKVEKITWVNPEMFHKFNYLCRVDIEEMFNKGQEYWQAVLIALRQQLVNDPYIDMEKLDQELLSAYFQSKGDKFMKINPELSALQIPQGQAPQGGSPGQMPNQVLNQQTAQAVEQSINQ